MRGVLIFKYVVALIFQIVFFCAGLLILSGGIMIFLDMNGIIESPIGYDEGVYTATIYSVVGFIWSIIVGVLLSKTIRTLISLKNTKEEW